jgi:hypothetical protein
LLLASFLRARYCGRSPEEVFREAALPVLLGGSSAIP